MSTVERQSSVRSYDVKASELAGNIPDKAFYVPFFGYISNTNRGFPAVLRYLVL
jgi:hypothetical protein